MIFVEILSKHNWLCFAILLIILYYAAGMRKSQDFYIEFICSETAKIKVKITVLYVFVFQMFVTAKNIRHIF